MREQSNILDDTRQTSHRAAHLRQPSYLRSLYLYWYHSLLENLPNTNGKMVELGSGGGFFKTVCPSITTTDVLDLPDVDLVVDARVLPWPGNSIRAIFATNVIHHIPEAWKFFDECVRVLKVGGRLILIEPWPTFFSIPIYRFLHHEPFNMQRDWGVPPGGPLTAANGALPWILFFRDRSKFEKAYPQLKILKIQPMMPFTYLVSGGIERRWPIPPWLFRFVRCLETPLDFLGLFALIVVEKTTD